jgi:ubiquinone biosynthesis protein COQ9
MTTPPLSALHDAESRLAAAVAKFIPELGLNRASVNAGARAAGFDDGERDLLAPNGGADIAAILWREHDAVLVPEAIDGMKIRDKIGTLLNRRLDAACANESVARRTMGFFALPYNALLYHRLLWNTADIIWRLSGDTALDENHYSKRLIVCGILSAAVMTRLNQGRDAQLEQINRNIQSVMEFEKFKAGVKFRPEQFALDLAGVLGRLRFGRSETAA